MRPSFFFSWSHAIEEHKVPHCSLLSQEETWAAILSFLHLLLVLLHHPNDPVLSWNSTIFLAAVQLKSFTSFISQIFLFFHAHNIQTIWCVQKYSSSSTQNANLAAASNVGMNRCWRYTHIKNGWGSAFYWWPFRGKPASSAFILVWTFVGNLGSSRSCKWHPWGGFCYVCYFYWCYSGPIHQLDMYHRWWFGANGQHYTTTTTTSSRCKRLFTGKTHSAWVMQSCDNSSHH